VNNGKYLQRLDLWGILAVIIPFSVYLTTLAPSVTFFDSGEFITANYSLGSAHSPGYPTFLNYAKPFTYLPFGSIAFRVNIATAFSAALACYAVYLLVSYILAHEELTNDPAFSRFIKNIAALSAALTFAFSARLWLQSNHDKPYPLVSFLAAMVFYLLLLWREHYRQGEERPAYVYLGAFLCGLTFGAHQTIVLLLPAYAFLLLSMDWRLVKRIKELILAIFVAFIGFSIHLYLPVRATRNPLLNWGDPQSISQFLWHLLRKGYPVDKPDRNLELLWAQLNAFNIPNEFTYPGLFILAIGIIAFVKTRRDEVLAYFIGIFCFLLVLVGFFNTPREVIFLTEEFFTPLYLLTAVFIGLGFFSLATKTLTIVPTNLLQTFPIKVLVGCGLLVLPVTVCVLHYLENDQHENHVAYDYASNTLRSLPQGAVLYTWGDSGAFPLWYIQGVERMREDLDLLHTPHLVFKWYLDAFPELFRNSALRNVPETMLSPDDLLRLSISELIDHRPVAVDFSTRYSVPLGTYSMIQRGICYQLEKNSSILYPPDLSVWSLYANRGVNSDMFFRDMDTGKAILIYATAHTESAETLFRIGRAGEARMELRIAESIAPDLHDQIVQIQNNNSLK
jgi:4-amino-4-deoxy-L-arabinose transferase-like glycosyltransferase